jgi:hypothetical protein
VRPDRPSKPSKETIRNQLLREIDLARREYEMASERSNRLADLLSGFHNELQSVALQQATEIKSAALSRWTGALDRLEAFLMDSTMEDDSQ